MTNAGLVLQTFCHTAAHPKPIDLTTHQTLPDFFQSRSGVAIRPGDGIVHSWGNRMLVPDTVGTGGDSHTRFPFGLSFPAGSGLVAYAAAVGTMPQTMPESVLVEFVGELQPGITVRDVVNGIPYFAIQQGKLTVPKQNKINVFSGRIMEHEDGKGCNFLKSLTPEQLFELTDTAAERSASGQTIETTKKAVKQAMRSDIAFLNGMFEAGYESADTLRRRINEKQAIVDDPNFSLLQPDANAEYADKIVVDLSQITEPIVCAPNDLDNVKKLSEVEGDNIDEIFIGSCMTNIGHYRSAAAVIKQAIQDTGEMPKAKCWFVPPTRMDEFQLRAEGIYDELIAAYQNVGATIFNYADYEDADPVAAMRAAMQADVVFGMPGCSLCMGNQARGEEGSTMFSTSTRNFDNRMVKNGRVYLGSAELAASCLKRGKIPTPAEYQADVAATNNRRQEFFRPLDFTHVQFAPALQALQR